MDHTVGKESRRELIRVVGQRYRSSRVSDKRRILDESGNVTGWHRKHAFRELNREGAAKPPRRAARSLYVEAIPQALLALWEAADRICSKCLKTFIPILLDALERHGHMRVALDIRSKLVSVSPATIDRLLAEPRTWAWIRITGRNSLTRRSSSSAPPTGSLSHARGPTERTTKPSSNRRTARWSGSWSVMADWRTSWPPRCWLRCMRQRGCS